MWRICGCGWHKLVLLRRVHLKIRFGDFQTISRSRTLGR